ncbi:receptor-like protein kinase [Trifolium medium]|uniref:Receptor-like protein kinase n=1 Tax=Trifolium medium TaxID=97028 RepID=A0A392LZP6_9FABA|nr:receptor-like protein kinase [Trifolium medium]
MFTPNPGDQDDSPHQENQEHYVEILNSIEFTWPCAGQGKIRTCGEHFSLDHILFLLQIADFGLTKLTDIASSTNNTDHVAGTFGYMSPENAYGHISRKIDVYAFGVVLYELISAKAAVIKIDKTEFKSLEFKNLVSLFDEVIDQEGNPIEEGLRKLVDPRLGDNYSIDSIKKMTQLAKTCTNRDPRQRPRMRAVVVSLMKLSTTIDDSSMIVSKALS